VDFVLVGREVTCELLAQLRETLRSEHGHGRTVQTEASVSAETLFRATGLRLDTTSQAALGDVPTGPWIGVWTPRRLEPAAESRMRETIEETIDVPVTFHFDASPRATSSCAVVVRRVEDQEVVARLLSGHPELPTSMICMDVPGAPDVLILLAGAQAEQLASSLPSTLDRENRTERRAVSSSVLAVALSPHDYRRLLEGWPKVSGRLSRWIGKR